MDTVKKWFVEWAFKIIVGGLLVGAFSFAWDTNADMTALKKDVARIPLMEEKIDKLTALILAEPGENAVLRTELRAVKGNQEKHEKLKIPGAHQ